MNRIVPGFSKKIFGGEEIPPLFPRKFPAARLMDGLPDGIISGSSGLENRQNEIQTESEPDSAKPEE